MRHFRIFFYFFILCSTAFAQSHGQKINRDFLDLLNSTATLDSIVDFFVIGDPSVAKQIVTDNNGLFKYSIGNISSVRLALNHLSQFENNKSISELFFSDMKNLKYCNDSAAVKCNIDKVHAGISPLTQPYTGKNVIIGFVELIDYRHPDFLDSLGRTRILYYWSGSDHTGTPPSSLGYGSEYNSTQIDSGLADSTIVDSFGHGTACAGIACGNGRANGLNRGMAPDANIIIAGTGNMADGIKYIFDKATDLGQPCVISISMGGNFEPMQNKNPINIIMDSLITAKPGRAIAVATGNSGNINMHYSYRGTSDTMISFFRENSSYGCYGCGKNVSLAGQISDLQNIYFSLSAYKDSMLNPSPAFTTPYYNFSQALSGDLRIMCADTLHHRNIVGLVADSIGTYGVMTLYEVGRPDCDSTSTYYWKISVTGNGNAEINRAHSETIDAIPSPVLFPEFQNYMFNDNLFQTSCYSISDKVISVGYAQNRNWHIDYNGNVYVDSNLISGNLMGTSSHGPTNWGVIKPDIIGVANYIMTAYPLLRRPYMIANEPYRIDSGGWHNLQGGSSMAAPLVAGGIALFFEKYPNATWLDVKNAIISCPIQDSFTGTQLPNNYWGYGKFNALGMLTNCVPPYVEEQNTFQIEVYPNPSANFVNFRWPSYMHQVQIIIYSAEGKLISENNILDKQQLSIENLPSGIYVYKFISVNNFSCGKLIVLN